MAEINEKDVPKKAAQDDPKAHDDNHDRAKAVTGDKALSQGGEPKDDTASTASRLLDSINRQDQEKSIKQSWDHPQDRGAAAEILSLNPLHDATDKKLEAALSKKSAVAVDNRFDFDPNFKDFSGFVNFGEKQAGNIGNLNGVWKDIFAPQDTRNIDSIDQMGFSASGIFTPGQAGGMRHFDFAMHDHDRPGDWPFQSDESAWYFNNKGDVDLSEALLTSYDSQALSVDNGGGKGMLGNLWSETKDAAGEVFDGVKKVGNATVSWLDSDSTSPESLNVTEVRHTPGGKVETTLSADKTVIKTDADTITQGRADADGRHETAVATNDGRTLSQDRDGIRTASSNDSDIVLKEDPRSGKVEALDKSGNQVAEFSNKGDASRFFDNSIVQVVHSTKSLDEAYQAFLKDHPDKLHDRPLLFMDGKGESLSVRPDGSVLRTHVNGSAEATFKHTGHDGQEHEIQVNVTEDAGGHEHFTIGHKGDQQFELNSQEAQDVMSGTRLRLSHAGHLMVNDHDSGDSHKEHWHHFMDKHHRIEAFPGGHISLHTGEVVIDDDKTHAIYTPNKDNGVTTMTEAVRHPDGTVDANPSRVWTMDNGKITTQGEDPTTGHLKANDVVTYDSNSSTLNAWNMEMTPTTATVLNSDGSKTTIDQRGDISAVDRNGNHIVDTSGDKISYDGGATYSDERSEYAKKSEHMAVDRDEDAAFSAAQAAMSIEAHLSADMTPAELASLAGQLSAAIARCMELGIPIPAQVSSAQAELANMQGKQSQKISREQDAGLY